MSRLILGINSAHADAAAVLVSDRGIEAAICEERLNRKKHCAGFPALAVAEVLRIAGASARDITDVSVARDPAANLLAKGLFVASHPRGVLSRVASRLTTHAAVRATNALVADALGVTPDTFNPTFHQVEHHLAHVASAFYPSRFETATGFSADGAGDFASNLVARCEGHRIRPLSRTFWPHSPGVFYTAMTQLIGFDRFGEEYKVMGLAAYGVPRFIRQMREVVRYDRDKGLRLNLRYFVHHAQNLRLESPDDAQMVHIPRLFSPALEALLGPARQRTDPLTDRERDLAASMQLRFEELYLAMLEDAGTAAGSRDFAMAGGCVLNSVANGRAITEGVIGRAFFHPAASDDGTAAGAALYVAHATYQLPRHHTLSHAYLGTAWSDAEIEQALVASGLPFVRKSRDALLETAVGALCEGRIMGWFQGREEWGPRALGNRSILCHPGWPGMKATLNARIKHREPFRPFAPAILADKLSTCFQGDHESPYMIVVLKVRPEWKERLSAITHEDGTGRVQTVTRDANPLYHDLIAAFERATGTPVLLNTSFNENEPIVHTPAQAIDCYARTQMDCLGIGSFWLEKPAS
jgi:carbamoyltransferase